MQLCERPSSISTINDVELVDSGQRDKISFVVMDMHIDEDIKNVETVLNGHW
jgi:hypothetical protein